MDKNSLTRLALSGMLAGGFALSACEKSATGSNTPATGIAAAKTLADFKAECEKSGGSYKAHDCQGMSDCKGYSFQEGKGVTQHECKGHSACMGGSCQEA